MDVDNILSRLKHHRLKSTLIIFSTKIYGVSAVSNRVNIR